MRSNDLMENDNHSEMKGSKSKQIRYWVELISTSDPWLKSLARLGSAPSAIFFFTYESGVPSRPITSTLGFFLNHIPLRS